MYKRIIFLFAIIFLTVFNYNAYGQTSFAILPMEVRGTVKPEKVEEAVNKLYQVLIDSGKYKIIDKDHVKDVLGEQSFQTSGVTNNKDAVKLGKLLNVDKLISTSMYMKKENQFAINMRVIDITTGQAELSKEISTQDYTAGDHGRFCAAEIIANYPLLGGVQGIVNDIVVVNMGSQNGLKPGDRLFVARKDVLRSNTGEILFQEYRRMGTLEVLSVESLRAKTKIRKLEKSSDTLTKEDIVSPEPIPIKETFISQTPLLGDIQKGKLILEDDMNQNQYLSVKNGEGESYINGKLHLNALQRKAGHAYCFYPQPFDQLSNIIFEGDVEFQETKNKYNKFDAVFRSNKEYGNNEYDYSFFFNNDGGYEVDLAIKGSKNAIIPLQSTPYLNRGAKKNSFRIVAYDSKFDLYLNDQFIAGFEHELLEKGAIGFKVSFKGHVTVSGVRVWEAVKK